jgi:hypothetical protein
MASQALLSWTTGESAERLDELFAVHVRVGGTQRGRRFATRELNAVIVSQVAAHFQRFCRDLHTEAASVLVAAAPLTYQPILRRVYANRRLDGHNAWPNVLKNDFGLFDFDLWAAAEAHHKHTTVRQRRLEQLNTWRNAIVHQDLTFSAERETLLAGTDLSLAWARRWRRAFHGLALSFDVVVGLQVDLVAGRKPW